MDEDTRLQRQSTHNHQPHHVSLEYPGMNLPRPLPQRVRIASLFETSDLLLSVAYSAASRWCRTLQHNLRYVWPGGRCLFHGPDTGREGDVTGAGTVPVRCYAQTLELG